MKKKTYTPPEIKSLPAREVVEQLGVAIAGTYGAMLNLGYGD